jgi:hypothetical protein
MHIAGIAATFLDAHLANSLQKRQRFDIAHGTADFDDRHIGAFRTTLDVGLDFIGDMRNDLHRLAEVFAAPLLADDVLVHLAGGEIIALAHACADEALVMTQVKVGLGTVIGDEHLSMLEWAHGARIDVDIGIQLEHGDPDAARFKNGAQRCGGNPLAQGRNHAAGNEYVFGHERQELGSGGRELILPETGCWNNEGLRENGWENAERARHLTIPH